MWSAAKAVGNEIALLVTILLGLCAHGTAAEQQNSCAEGHCQAAAGKVGHCSIGIHPLISGTSFETADYSHGVRRQSARRDFHLPRFIPRVRGMVQIRGALNRFVTLGNSRRAGSVHCNRAST